jgi:hypothetical protein
VPFWSIVLPGLLTKSAAVWMTVAEGIAKPMPWADAGFAVDWFTPMTRPL